MAQDFRNVVARAQGTTAAAILTGGMLEIVITLDILLKMLVYLLLHQSS